MNKVVTSGELLRECRGLLTQAGIEAARHEAALLISHHSGYSVAKLYSHPELPLEAAVNLAVRRDLQRRLNHEPMAYILGSWDFYGLTFDVGPGVLIPRPETERLVETAKDQAVLRFPDRLWAGQVEKTPPLRVLDTCTGSGCVGIATAFALQAAGFAVDLTVLETDPLAATFARRNLDRQGLGDIPSDQPGQLAGTPPIQARLILADLWPAPGPVFDVITANPPYIVQSVLQELMPDVRDHEPQLALDGGVDGLDFYRRLVQESPAFLAQPGLLLLEHGYDQADALARLLAINGFNDLLLVHDYAGHPRVSGGWRSGLPGPDSALPPN